MPWIARAAAPLAATLFVVGVAGVALAAQPRRAPPKPKPPAAASDAGASDNPYADDKSKGDGGAPAAPSSAAAPAAPPELYDGGVRPSPLTPAANEFPDGGAPPQSLDYDRLLADIAALRARVAAVSDTMFRSRIVVQLETSGDHGRIARLGLSLDDGVVYSAPQGFHADDMTTIYDHALAPGRHAVTLEVERKDDRNEAFRTAQRSRFIVDVPRDHRLELRVRIWDDSNMGGDFPSDKSGRYELKIRANAAARPVGP